MDLVADLSKVVGESVKDLGAPFKLADKTLAVAGLPVKIGGTVVMGAASTPSVTTGNTKLTVGATASATAKFGFRYMDTEVFNGGECYFISTVYSTLSTGKYAYVNQDCASSILSTTGGIKWVKESSVTDAESRSARDAIAEADFGFEYRPLTVSTDSPASGAEATRSLIHVGPKLQVMLYDAIPINIFLGGEFSPFVNVGNTSAPALSTLTIPKSRRLAAEVTPTKETPKPALKGRMLQGVACD